MVIAFLRIIIADTANYFNVGGNMNEDQIKATATDILEDYYYLSIDDFKLCFGKGRKLHYGEIYRMDGSIILGWLGQYTEERMNKHEEWKFKQHSGTKHKRDEGAQTARERFDEIKYLKP